ncbi:hypothetical protein OG800_49715 (plasmid) [Streptomyces sp. NBC_00445]|uniref:hypothetical protein n=1 Tax=Streptomyces sp. NBC_00445 TaxID=2975745 RepID=UPI002E1E0023
MMQHARAPVQEIVEPQRPEQSSKATNSSLALVVSPEDQEVGTTSSRRTRRAEFMHAAAWAIRTGRHPQASETTMRVAEDLAGRLNADGHVAYARDAMWRRLHISRRTLERHIAVLRELGLLVWVVHGSRTNTRPAGCGQWAGTATIYAAVVPRAWDDIRGHRIAGNGYHARHVGFTERGRQLAIADAQRRAHRPPRHDAPSCKDNHIRRRPQVAQNKNNTSATRCQRRPLRPRGVEAAYRATPEQAADAVTVAAMVRPRVPWTQAENLRRLAFALRPWIYAGNSAHEIAAELTAWWIPYRPSSPAALIMARWREHAAAHLPDRPMPPQHEPPPSSPNRAFRTAAAHLRTAQAPQTASHPEPEPPDFVIRDRILASLRQAQRAWRERGAEECATYAEWDAIADAKGRAAW